MCRRHSSKIRCAYCGVARFAARFAPLGFRVAPETLALMRAMVERREVDALVPERVWQETEKALREPQATEFFRVLRDCGALQPVYPEIDALFGVPQPAQWHPEIDTGRAHLDGARSGRRTEHGARRCALPRWCTISARERRRTLSGPAIAGTKSAALR